MVRRTISSAPPWDVAKLPQRLAGFVTTWRAFNSTEQSGAQSFLRDLLEVYDVDFVPGTIFEQHPVKIPAAGAASQAALFPGEAPAVKYTTERMDMYLPKRCVWEMKAPEEKDLQKHHGQILGYWSRMRTRYMVLCNFHEFWVYDTDQENGQLAPALKFTLTELPGRGDALMFLRGEVADLETRAVRVTRDVARQLGHLLRDITDASPDPDRERTRVAKFLLECVFAMFAEDSELIPAQQFTSVLREASRAGRMDTVWSLFDDFSRSDPRDKGNRFAPYINGSLFDSKQPKVTLSAEHIHGLYTAAKNFDWNDVRPEIFGSIFEQALSAVDRHSLGAHFTDEADILRVVKPTVIDPWIQRIAAVRTPKDALAAVEAMKDFHILDPACGCGNFLYVAYRAMKVLESALVVRWNSAQKYVAKRRRDMQKPPPGPWFTLHQLHGIELDPFAASLARVVLWIGEHLAKRELGLDEDTLPLKNLDATIVQGDALRLPWPRPEGELAIVGNPPYLGVRKMRHDLGDEYVDMLAKKYPANRAADLVTHWFTRALEVLRDDERAGFVCTNSIAQNESREASIDAVLAHGATLTDAWRSYPWRGEAAVHVAVVNWVMARYEGVRHLDGAEVDAISPTLTAGMDVTRAETLEGNQGLCFMGVTPGNHGFVLTAEERAEILAGDPTSAKVIKPFLIGRDVNREIDQQPTRWIIDFAAMEKAKAMKHPGAWRWVQKNVYPTRSKNPRESYMAEWWQFWRSSPNLRTAIKGMKHVLVIPAVGPHLMIVRSRANVCFDHQLMVVALESFYHLGLLQSRLHDAWAWARCSTLKGDLRYTGTTAFQTFPFPYLPRGKYAPAEVPATAAGERLETAARLFDALRSETCRARDLGLTKVHNLLAAGEIPALTDAYTEMNDAATACYGFPEGVWRDPEATLKALHQRNAEIAAGG